MLERYKSYWNWFVVFLLRNVFLISMEWNGKPCTIMEGLLYNTVRLLFGFNCLIFICKWGTSNLYSNDRLKQVNWEDSLFTVNANGSTSTIALSTSSPGPGDLWWTQLPLGLVFYQAIKTLNIMFDILLANTRPPRKEKEHIKLQHVYDNFIHFTTI